MLTPEEYERNEQIALAGQSADATNSMMKQQCFMEEQEKGMIKEQLDLSEEIKKMTLLLRGYHEEFDVESERIKWVKPVNDEMVILTEYGINLILNSLGFYLNKNTLLSNYDDRTILVKMRDFASSLNKTVFMEYQKIFKQPTFEDCKRVLAERINKKVELRQYALELMGKKSNAKEIEKEMIDQMEDRVEKEIGKIRETIMKTKFTRYLLLIREVQDVVHSTYLRAWKGQERATLRQHTQITETRGGVPVQQTKGGIFSFLKG